MLGICAESCDLRQTGLYQYSGAVYWYGNGGKYIDGVNTSYASGSNALDIIGVAIDKDNDTIEFFVNNSSQGSFSFSASTCADEAIMPLAEGYGSNGAVWANFGADSSFANNKTSGSANASDANGVGDFYYTPPSGFLALCTSNLPDPTVIPSEHFNAVTWTGNTTDSTTTNTITGVGFEPSFVWTKVRSNTDNHRLLDQVRGGTKKLASNTTGEELTRDYGKISAWNTNGFTVSGADGYEMNYNNATYVSWCWKAGGAGVSNTNGTIATTVSANVDAGFSIVSWSGNSTSGATLGHGLGAVPEMIIVKQRNSSGTWWVYHKDLSATPNNDRIRLSSGLGLLTSDLWNDTDPTSTVLTVNNDTDINGTGSSYIGYFFKSVPSYSKIGLSMDKLFMQINLTSSYSIFNIFNCLVSRFQHSY